MPRTLPEPAGGVNMENYLRYLGIVINSVNISCVFH
jgi:hypothetical protein